MLKKIRYMQDVENAHRDIYSEDSWRAFSMKCLYVFLDLPPLLPFAMVIASITHPIKTGPNVYLFKLIPEINDTMLFISERRKISVVCQIDIRFAYRYQMLKHFIMFIHKKRFSSCEM